MPRRNRNAPNEAHLGSKSPYFLNGNHFSNLTEFYGEVKRVLNLRDVGQLNLDAFADVLTWPCDHETDRPYALVWLNSDVSRQRLHHGQMVDLLEEMLRRCHPSNVPSVTERLVAAMQGEEPNLFEFLVETIELRAEYVRLVLS